MVSHLGFLEKHLRNPSSMPFHPANVLFIGFAILSKIMCVKISKVLRNQVSCLPKWSDYFCSLLVKVRLKPDLETSVSIDDVISLDESISLDNLSLSPTHYMEKAGKVF